jgi:flavin-dependent dehydrogenase
VIAFSARGPWPAYAWSFPIGDGRANVGYGEGLGHGGEPTPRALLLERLEELLPGTASQATALKGHHLPLSTGRVRQPDGAVLLAGDAMALVNPLTGEGIHAAVRSGALAGIAAAKAMRQGRADQAGGWYRTALRSAFGAHLRSVAFASGFGHRIAPGTGKRRFVVAAGVKAAERDQRVFDDLIEMGLADGGLTARTLVGIARAFVS